MPTGLNIENIVSVKPILWIASEHLNLIKAFAKPDGRPPEKDPVFVYKFYSEKRPSSMQSVEAPYYLGINHSKDSSKCWFKASAMGVNTSLMKTMAGKAGFERRLTNHKRAKASDAKTEQ